MFLLVHAIKIIQFFKMVSDFAMIQKIIFFLKVTLIEKLYRRHNWKTSFFIFCARKRVLFLFRLSKQNYCYFRLILTYFSPVLHELMNCFCGMVDRRKVFSLISSRDHCKRSSPSRISGTPRAGFEPAQNLSSALVE